MLNFGRRCGTSPVVITQLSAFRRLSAPPAAAVHAQVQPRHEPPAAAEPKPYSAIPGPLKLPYLGTAWSFVLPWNWGKSILTMHRERAKKYGKIYREHFPSIGDAVMLLDADDAQKFFRAQGKYPKRIPFDVWIRSKKDLQIDLGLFST